MFKRIVLYVLVVLVGFILFASLVPGFLPPLVFRHTLVLASQSIAHREAPRFSGDGTRLAWVEPQGDCLRIGPVCPTGTVERAIRIALPQDADTMADDRFAINWAEGGNRLVVAGKRRLLLVDALSGQTQALGVQELFPGGSDTRRDRVMDGAWISADGGWLAVGPGIYRTIEHGALFRHAGAGYTRQRTLSIDASPRRIVFSDDGRYMLMINSQGLELSETAGGRIIADEEAIVGEKKARLSSADAVAFRRGGREVWAMHGGSLIAFDHVSATRRVLIDRGMTLNEFFPQGERVLIYGPSGALFLMQGDALAGGESWLKYDPAYRGTPFSVTQCVIDRDGGRVAVLWKEAGSDESGRSRLDLLAAPRLPELHSDRFKAAQRRYSLIFAALLVVLCLVWEFVGLPRWRGRERRAGRFSGRVEAPDSPPSAAGTVDEAGRIRLICPRCGAASFSDHPEVRMQWHLLQQGNSISGGVVLHCHTCAFSAPLTTWYETARQKR